MKQRFLRECSGNHDAGARTIRARAYADHVGDGARARLSCPVLSDFDALPQGALLITLPSPFRFWRGYIINTSRYDLQRTGSDPLR